MKNALKFEKEMMFDVEQRKICENKSECSPKNNFNGEIKIKSDTSAIISEQNDENIINDFQYIAILEEKYGLIQKIGEGSTSKIYLGYPLNGENIEQKFYSIKILKTEKLNIEMFNSEVSLLQSIKNEHVLCVYEYGKGQKVKKNGKSKEVYYIVMELMEHGDLIKYISNISSKSNENIGFGEDFGRLIFSQLLDGLEAIHNSDGVHRDIKPDNIMIGNDYKMKFVDLGFSTKKSNVLLKQYLGTPAYAAPEIHLRRPYLGEMSDIFSLGITLFVLVTGSLPFRLPVPNGMLYQFFVRNDYIGFWRQRKVRVSVSFMQLFDNLVAFDYTQRPSISEIRKSKWMQETNYSLMPQLLEELKRREFIINEKLNKNKNINSCNNIKTNLPLIEIQRVKKDEEIYNYQKYINNNNTKNDNNIMNNKKILPTICSNIGNIKDEYNISTQKEMIIEKEEELIKLSSISILKPNENVKNIKNNHNIKNKGEDGICIMVPENDLVKIITEIYKYLKNKDFNNVEVNMNELKIFVNSNKIGVDLFFENYKKNIIKINYLKKKGTTKDFSQFKKIIKNIKFRKIK
jgi:serine/threonine protein kinase